MALATTAAGVEQLPYAHHGGQTAAQHKSKGSFSGKHDVGVGELHPGVRESATVEDVQRLEDADEELDTGELVLVESALGTALELVKAAIGDATQQAAGVLVAELPTASDGEEAFDSGGTQAFLNAAVRQVDGLGPRHTRELRG